MPLKPAPIVISDTVYQIVSKFARSRTLPACQVERAKIFMLCADGLNNLQISERVSIGQDSVSKWRTRFLNSLSRLQEVEKQNPTEFESEVTALLSDYARPGQPPASRPLLAAFLRKSGKSGNIYGKSQ